MQPYTYQRTTPLPALRWRFYGTVRDLRRVLLLEHYGERIVRDYAENAARAEWIKTFLEPAP